MTRPPKIPALMPPTWRYNLGVMDWKLGLAKWAGLTSGVVSLVLAVLPVLLILWVLPVLVPILLICIFASLSSGQSPVEAGLVRAVFMWFVTVASGVCGFRAFFLARRGVFSTFCVFFPVGVVILRLLFSLL